MSVQMEVKLNHRLETAVVLKSTLIKVQLTKVDVIYSSDQAVLTAEPADDLSVTGIKISPLTVEVDFAFGDVGYIKSNGHVDMADASVIATANAIVMCAVPYILAGNSGMFLVLGIARNDAWTWTVGQKIYLSLVGVSGWTLTQVAPSGPDQVIQVIGMAMHAHRMLFKPELVQVEHR